MNQSFSRKTAESMLENDFALFTFILGEVKDQYEGDFNVNRSETYYELLDAMTDTVRRITEMTQDEGFSEGCTDSELVLKAYGLLPPPDQKAVLCSVDVFLRILRDSMAGVKGKALQKQEDLYGRSSGIREILLFSGKEHGTDAPYREALFTGLDEAEKQDGKRRDFLQDLRSRLEKADGAEGTEKALCSILDGLGEEDRKYVCLSVLGGAKSLFQKQYRSMLDEYDGLDVDLSKYTDRLSAVMQLESRLRKKYC